MSLLEYVSRPSLISVSVLRALWDFVSDILQLIPNHRPTPELIHPITL